MKKHRYQKSFVILHRVLQEHQNVAESTNDLVPCRKFAKFQEYRGTMILVLFACNVPSGTTTGIRHTDRFVPIQVFGDTSDKTN